MILILTAAAFALAWFSFRYERLRRRRSAVDAAYGALQAAYQGMVQGVPHGIVEGEGEGGQPAGWTELYFSTVYTEEAARTRATEMADTVMNMNYDQVFVVPTEPLAHLATLATESGFVEPATVAAANTALWKVQTFNQLVAQLTGFYTTHGPEIVDPDTPDGRRKALAEVVWRFGYVLHRHAIGEANLAGGWYRRFSDALSRNIAALERLRKDRWQWLREWPYVIGDLVVAGLVIAVVVAAAHPGSDHDRRQRHRHRFRPSVAFPYHHHGHRMPQIPPQATTTHP